MATILTIDAHQEFSAILRQTLSAYGHEVLQARNSAAGLQLADSHRPAVVLLDVKLPDGIGLDVLVKLRAKFPSLPIIILAEEITVEEENRARELGAAHVRRKGLKLDIIMETVNHVLQFAGRPVSITSVSKETTPSTILLVDDEVEIRELVGEFLQRRGYRIKTAASGEEGLATIKNKPPDLVLLDVYMPGMNGVEMLRQVSKSHPAVGVIMLTASQDGPLLKSALDLGAFDILSKPVDLKQLELAVLVKLALSLPD